MNHTIYQDDLIKVEIEPFEIPWLKVFTQEHIKELSLCDDELRFYLFETINIIEKTMLKILNPDKINIASFGNYVPHVHFHIQARYKNDSYFPEPTWGIKQRKINFEIKDLDDFYLLVKEELNKRKETN